MGYVLPWGQMSFWGRASHHRLFSAIPLIGNALHEWCLGGFGTGNAALNRFFSLHYLLPFVVSWERSCSTSGRCTSRVVQPTGVEVKARATRFRSSLTYRQGRMGGRRVPVPLCAVVFFFPERARAPGQLHPGNR